MAITQYNSNNSLAPEFKWTSFEKEIIWINWLTYRPRLKKDLWSKFRLGSKIRTKDRHNPESASKLTANPRSTVFLKSAISLDLPQKSTIRALFKAKSVDPKTYSPPSIYNQACRTRRYVSCNRRQIQYGSTQKISVVIKTPRNPLYFKGLMVAPKRKVG